MGATMRRRAPRWRGGGEMERHKVLVAGATGYLGKHVVRALHDAGYPVRALARKVERLGEVRALCTDVVEAEATKPETLDALVGDAKILFSSLGKHDFKRKPTVREIDYQANMNILERAKAGGVEHVVFISVVNGAELRQRGVGAATAREDVVDAIKASGLQWTIIRPTGFFNDMADIFQMAVRGTGWLLGDGSLRMNPIHGADLADFITQRIGDPKARGEDFPVGGPDVLTYREVLELAFRALGKEPKLRSVPMWTLKAGAPLVGLFSPMAKDVMDSFSVMTELQGTAPPHGTHHLADFYAELAEKARAG
jgi:uncharacterized protein YbjT (DUF2867 family)